MAAALPSGIRCPAERVIDHFYDHPLYIEALEDRIELAYSHFEHPTQAHIVFSAHGLPMSLIEKGDPYQKQIEQTVALVMERGGWPNGYTLCYQSRVGRKKWLEPSLTATLPELVKGGKKNLLVVPLSFVTEHIETLHEINIEAREQAMALGVEQFEMMPAVGDSPRFIGALADLVLRAVGVEAVQRCDERFLKQSSFSVESVEMALTLSMPRHIYTGVWRSVAIIPVVRG